MLEIPGAFRLPGIEGVAPSVDAQAPTPGVGESGFELGLGIPDLLEKLGAQGARDTLFVERRGDLSQGAPPVANPPSQGLAIAAVVEKPELRHPGKGGLDPGRGRLPILLFAVVGAAALGAPLQNPAQARRRAGIALKVAKGGALEIIG